MSDVHEPEVEEEPLFDSRTGEPIEPGTKATRDLRAAAARGEKHRQEAEQLKREMAFLKAGVDTDSKAGKLLLKAYDGDLTDIAALKSEAESIGALTAPATTPPDPTPTTPAVPDNPITPAEAQALAQRGQVASGAQPSDSVTQGKDPKAMARAEFDRMVIEGRSKEDAAAVAFRAYSNAFVEGDPRTQWRDQGQGATSQQYPVQ